MLPLVSIENVSSWLLALFVQTCWQNWHLQQRTTAKHSINVINRLFLAGKNNYRSRFLTCICNKSRIYVFMIVKYTDQAISFEYLCVFVKSIGRTELVTVYNKYNLPDKIKSISMSCKIIQLVYFVINSSK